MNQDQYDKLRAEWEAGDHTEDQGTGSRNVTAEQWVQHIKPDGSLEDIGPGMTPSEGSVPLAGTVAPVVAAAPTVPQPEDVAGRKIEPDQEDELLRASRFDPANTEPLGDPAPPPGSEATPAPTPAPGPTPNPTPTPPAVSAPLPPTQTPGPPPAPPAGTV